MGSRAIQFTISAVFACAAGAPSAAQSLDRVFHFVNTQTPAGFKQVADPIRGMTEGAQVSVDDAAATLTVHGTADQLAMAEWLFVALDKPAVGQPPAQHAASADYHVAGSEDLVRVYYLAHSETPQSLQEMVNLIRSDANMKPAWPNNAVKAMAMRGTPGQLGLAEYLIDALDKPAGQPNQHSTTLAFPVAPEVAPGSGQVARVFYLANVDSPQRMQQTVNLIRSITDMQLVFPYNSLKALTLRGSADQMALAEWLFNGLDKPASQPSQHTATAEYLAPPGPGNLRNQVVRIFYLAHSEPPQGPQEMTNLIRVTTDAQGIYPYQGLNAIAMRGSASQVALASWFFDTLDQPSPNPSTQEFPIPGASNDVARVFYLTHTATPEAVQELSTLIRTTASIMRLFPYSPPKALAMRGTPDQLALAAKLIQERDQ
ncbi:MAG TPA: hypothetical protein VNY05_16430 [Candidatus Acidoferrales bacterium]|jgi:hypothetical protein|nr:hypothetical protein [Candidatus Acidoferrales bacterium]